MLNHLITYLLKRRLRHATAHAQWTPEDETALFSFLSSAAGKRFIFVLQKSAIQRNVSAVMNGTPHACGQAAGYSLVLQDIHTLSGAATQCGIYSEDPANQGSAGSLDHLHP